jgi:hypothetical protein
MDNQMVKTLLEEIGNIIDRKLEEKLEQKLEEKLEPIRKIMATKDDLASLKIDLEKKIEDSQEDTTEVLSELINIGYAIHDKKIAEIEKELDLSGSHKN